MKQLLFAVLLFAQGRQGYGQLLKELPVYSNGFIYTDTAIQKLKHMVDSVNLQYKRGGFNREYYSVKQGLAHYIQLNKRDARAATTDMLNDISFTDFIKKFPAALVDSNQLLIEKQAQNSKKEWYDVYDVWRYEPDQNMGLSAPGEGNVSVGQDGDRILGKKGNWVFEYQARPYDSTKWLKAIYIVQQPVARVIPDDYARLISYADCMIDTTSDIFFETARDEPLDIGEPLPPLPPVIGQFLNYVNREADSALLKYDLKQGDWSFTDSLKQAFIKNSLSKSPVFRRLLSQAVEQTLRLKLATNSWFEYYTELYYSKSAALAMQRNRIAWEPVCGQGTVSSYLISIARLAAETANWQVFLRVHLDVMRQQFEWNSNPALANWKACIKAIEALDIDVQGLMLGISLDISNPPSNHYHYFDYFGRPGRIFTETKDSIVLEKRLLSAIRDTRLDYYNRMRLRELFLTYAYYLPGKGHRMACIEQLKEADKSLPPFLLTGERIQRDILEGGVAQKGY